MKTFGDIRKSAITILEDKTMKFKVGDRIRVNIACSNNEVGDIVTLYKEDGILYAGDCDCQQKWTKIGGSMSKYEELKSRIEALSNGWDKEADDIIVEINREKGYTIEITNHRITCFAGGYESFTYNTQCEKNSAFKKALLWLLDNSNIKKDEKADKIKELESKVKDIQAEIQKLK